MIGRALMLIFVMLIGLSLPAETVAKSLVVDLARDHVDISTGFDGADLILYGSFDEDHSDVAVVIQGPETDMTLRKKERVLGLWMNRYAMVFPNIPGYYDFATSRPLSDLQDEYNAMDQFIGLDSLLIEPIAARHSEEKTEIFKQSLVRKMKKRKLFPEDQGKVEILGDGFFKIVLPLPANMPTGIYQIKTFTLDDGGLQDMATTSLRVAQVGMAAQIHDFSKDHSFFYGLFAVLFAAISGWSANALVRRD